MDVRLARQKAHRDYELLGIKGNNARPFASHRSACTSTKWKGFMDQKWAARVFPARSFVGLTSALFTAP